MDLSLSFQTLHLERGLIRHAYLAFMLVSDRDCLRSVILVVTCGSVTSFPT